MSKQILICVILLFISVQISQIYSQNSSCNLKKGSNREIKILEKLLTLNISRHFTFTDEEHLYNIGICTKATNDSVFDVGVLQTNTNSTKKFIIGRLSDVDIEGSDQYIRITYKNGDRYGNACNKTERTTVIAIMCNPNNKEEFSLLEENNERGGEDCAYYFQLLTPEMCTKINQTTSAPSTPTATVPTTVPTTIKPTAAPTTIKPATTASINQSTTSKQANNSTTSQQTSEAQNATTSTPKPNTSSKFGFFSITILILLGLLFIYFTIGTLYRRFVNQARGIEQLPHWQIFHTLGIKFQDCGQFICHCGKKPSEIRSYEHINDQLSDDENLLNM